ncbi:hypothetical protein IQ288_31580 [Burkholderia sp. R-69980]|nr:hypothetical protein [Burkholderia sp. R-69980]
MLNGVYVSLLMGPMVPMPAPKPVVDALTSIEIEVPTSRRSGFQLSFSLGTNSSLQTLFLLASGAPMPMFRVVIVVTVNGLPQVLMDGVIQHHEIQQGEAGTSTLHVKGEDLSALMDLQALDGLPYPGATVDNRVKIMLAKYAVFGVRPNVMQELVPNIDAPVERIASQRGTDFKYIQALAGVSGYVFYLDPGPLPGMSEAYWGPEIKFGLPQPALAINVDSWSNCESLHFQYEPAGAELPVVYFQEPNSKQTIPVPIPAVSPLNPPLGALSATPQKITFSTDTAKQSPGQALMQGMAKAAQTGDVVTGSGTLDVLRYGQVLKARQLVGVRGAGLAFDGLHFVDSVTHTISRGQYKQNFSLKRNGLLSTLPAVPTMF